MYLLCKLIIPFKINVAKLLVAYADIAQVERLGVSHINTELHPFIALVSAVCELDKVKRVINIRLQLVHRYKIGLVRLAAAARLTRHTAVQDRNRLHTQILTHLEILVKAQTVGHHICVVRRAPNVHHFFSFGNIAYGVLPVPRRFHCVALNSTAAGETEKLRVHCF